MPTRNNYAEARALAERVIAREDSRETYWNRTDARLARALLSALAEIEAALREREEARAAKDGAYRERDQLVAALSKLFPSFLARHPDSDASWDDDWRWIVFVSLPTGQASWHIHDSELSLFAHLERVTENPWDGHTTEEKYGRLAALDAGALEASHAALAEALRNLIDEADDVIGYERFGDDGKPDESSVTFQPSYKYAPGLLAAIKQARAVLGGEAAS